MFSGKRKNRERYVTFTPGNFQRARKNRERWITPKYAANDNSLTVSNNFTASRGSGGGGAGGTGGLEGGDPLPPDSVIEGIGDGTIVPYDPTDFNATYPGSNFNSGTTVPADRGCPPYSHLDYPMTCPQERTFAWQESVFQPVLDEGNVYRAARGLSDLIFDNYLTLAAQRHATYVAENWDTLYAAGMPLNVAHGGLQGAHYELAPPDPTFGETVGVRVVNTGRDDPTAAGVAEGIAFGSNTPMEGLCNQKADYVDNSNPGHFGPWYGIGDLHNYVGWGQDRVPGGWVVQVFVYANDPPGANADTLLELHDYLPKFKCV
jgi:hypothetical protein